MKLVPSAIARKVARSGLIAQKNAPSYLFVGGVVGMVGSTVLACRATLKLDEVLAQVQHDQNQELDAKHAIDSNPPTEVDGQTLTYTDFEHRKALAYIYVRGVGNVTKLYAPSIILGAASMAALTKSHNILQERNLALAAAYTAVDSAFNRYRERVIERYGEEMDREFNYDLEEVQIIDEETGETVSRLQMAPGELSGYKRWFDSENSNWNDKPYDEYNWLFLRSQQNWANDFLRTRGHLFLNEVYRMLGLEESSAGAVVGWVYDPHNMLGKRTAFSDNYVDFGCWDSEDSMPLELFNGRDGSILLDFNVDGPVWDLIDEMKKRNL